VAGPSVMVRILGDVTGLSKSMGDTGAAAESAASKARSAFSGMLDTLNKTGVLGPFGEALGGIDEAIGKVIQHGKDIGAGMMAAGGAMAGVGVGLAALGSKDQAAHQQLQAAVEATGNSYEDYGKQVDDAIKSQEKYGNSASTTQNALATLTEATHDPAKALQLLGETSDVAAAKHESLTQAAGDVGKVYNGNTKLLKTFGITVDSTTKLTNDHKTATQALADVTKGQAAAATDTFAGKLDAMKTKIEDSAAAFGQKYGPALAGAGTAMSGLGAVWKTATGIKEALTAATDAGAAADDAAAVSEGIALGPILLIIGAVAVLGVAIYELATHWSTVWDAIKAAVAAVWDWIRTNWPLLLAIILGPFAVAALEIYKHWDTIKAGAKDVIDFITGIWNGLVGFFTGLPGRITSALAGVWDGFKNAAKAAFNAIADLWNGTVGSLSFHIPSWVPTLGGKGFDMPHIPHMASGGIVTSPTLALIGEAGPEAVVPLGRGGGHPGPLVQINGSTFNSATDVDMIAKRLELATRSGVRMVS
jgi:hypothetical protein